MVLQETGATTTGTSAYRSACVAPWNDLIIRSIFLPRIFGAIAAFSGLWYLTRLYPPLVSALFPYTLIVPAIGVMVLILWLTIKGVDAQRWKEQATKAELGP